MTTTTNRDDDRPPTPQTILETSLAQLYEDSRVYNEAVASYNSHLDNHRDHRDLQDLPYRRPVSSHDTFDGALEGDPDATETLLAFLLDQGHLDSQLRCHPETYPIHIDALEHLRMARERLITTLEGVRCHVNETDD